MRSSRCRRRVADAALAVVLATAPLGLANDGGDVVEACGGAAGGDANGRKACRTLEQFVTQTGRGCRVAGPPDACVLVDGRLVSPALVDAYEDSWVPRALALQRGLDDALPLQEELWVHTHNSFNSEAYDATLSGLDPNQVYSMTDQLRMGVRAIEIDVHWAPSAEADPADWGMAPIVCHGEPEGIGPFVLHFGCTAEVHLRARLAEVRAWLDANPAEIVMIYLENNLDDDALAHQRATEAIEETLDPLVYRPSVATCTDLPLDDSRADIRDANKRVILTGNCGPGAWTSWVFRRGGRWMESSSAPGVEYPDYPACVADRRAPNKQNYTENWIRHWHDSTWLTAMLSDDGRAPDIPAEEARRMVRCGVNMVGFDQLHPDDPRLEALVWSWAQDEPAATGDCAYAGSDGRFRAGDCGTARAFACVTASGTWTAAGPAGAWSGGAAACAASGGLFSVPANGYQNELLTDAAGGAEVWLDYALVGGTWTPEAAG